MTRLWHVLRHVLRQCLWIRLQVISGTAFPGNVHVRTHNIGTKSLIFTEKRNMEHKTQKPLIPKNVRTLHYDSAYVMVMAVLIIFLLSSRQSLISECRLLEDSGQGRSIDSIVCLVLLCLALDRQKIGMVFYEQPYVGTFDCLLLQTKRNTMIWYHKLVTCVSYLHVLTSSLLQFTL